MNGILILELLMKFIKKSVVNIINSKKIYYITIIIIILLLLYINPLMLIEVIAETNDIEELKNKINEINNELIKAEKDIKNLEENVNKLKALSKTLVICVLLVMAISGYN
jgi:hypothetical protein